MDVVVERIFNLMKIKGMTSKELAENLGISKSNISEWKARRSTPNKHLAEIAQLLDTTVAYLIGETDNPTPEIKLAREGETIYFHMDKKFSELSPEKQQEVADFIDFLRNRPE